MQCGRDIERNVAVQVSYDRLVVWFLVRVSVPKTNQLLAVDFLADQVRNCARKPIELIVGVFGGISPHRIQ